MREPDAVFADPRQAVLYDALDGDRTDLDVYVRIAGELRAQVVVDVGCGTGSLAVRLADAGLSVVGIDPAAASLDVARSKPGAGLVRWVHGDATCLPDLGVVADLALMTANVAQVFVSDTDWFDTLEGVRAVLSPGGWLVFETRRPEARDWENWTLPPTQVRLPDGRAAVVSRTVTEVAFPLVTFESSTSIGHEVLLSTSTLRFRRRPEIERQLVEHGFTVVDVREAPDRPGKEFVFLARASVGDTLQP